MRWLGKEKNGQPKSWVADFFSIKLASLPSNPGY